MTAASQPGRIRRDPGLPGDNRPHARRYLAGRDYAIADIASYPWLVSWQQQGIDLDEFHYVQRWFAQLFARPAVRRRLAMTAGSAENPAGAASTPPQDGAEAITRIAVGYLFGLDGRVLLGRRALDKTAWSGRWDIFGGHLEPDETPGDALVREFREELRIDVTRSVLLSDRVVPGPVDPRSPLHFTTYVIMDWRNGPPRISNDEHSEIRWFTRDEAMALPDAVPNCLIQLDAAAALYFAAWPWPADALFRMGDYAAKKGRAAWRGRIVGWYRTDLTDLGYAIESHFEPGSVQIYPQGAIEPWQPPQG